MARWLLLLVFAVCFQTLATRALAAPDGGTPGAATVGAREEVSPDSPRASYARFLDACRRGDFHEAAGYLDTRGERDKEKPAELARKLKTVLDRRLGLRPEDLSPLSDGNREPGVPLDQEELGKLVDRNGTAQPLRMQKRDIRGEPRWVFHASAVARIDDWYDGLEHGWARKHLAPQLLAHGPADIALWQWLSLPIALGGAWGLGRLLGWASLRVFVATLRRRFPLIAEASLDLSRPLSALWMVGLMFVAARWVALPIAVEKKTLVVIQALSVAAAFWALLGAIGTTGKYLTGSDWSKDRPSAISFLPFVTKFLKVTVFCVGAVAVLSQLGYPVGNVVTGLGIGGVALALAAQKTLEHLFGSIAISIDQPFRVGDAVSIDGTLGAVEAIGLRSTRIRTADRTLVTIPNGKLADMKVECYSARDKLRVLYTLSLEWSAASDTVAALVRDLETLLERHPKYLKEVSSVLVTKLGAGTIDIEVSAYYKTNDVTELSQLRAAQLLEVHGALRERGVRLATIPIVVAPALPK